MIFKIYFKKLKMSTLKKNSIKINFLKKFLKIIFQIKQMDFSKKNNFFFKFKTTKKK